MYSNECLALWGTHRGMIDTLGAFILVTRVATDQGAC